MKPKVFISILAMISLLGLSMAQQTRMFASINGKTSGIIKKSDIIGQLIKVSNDDYKVVSYVFILKNDQSNIRIQEHSEQITKRCSNHIRTAPSGTTIIIEEIESQNSNGHKVKLPPLKFTLE